MIADWYHCTLKAISRSEGRSAVACAAYRTGLALDDERYGERRDFTHKGDVVGQFTLAPAEAPGWARDVSALWNAVETVAERRANSTVAFDWEIALPAEIDASQREAIARRFAGWLVESYGVAVTVGLHTGTGRGNGLNEHLHAQMTTRPITAAGWAKNKLRDFNCRPGTPNPEVERVRAMAAECINDALAEADSETRVSHLSLEARGITREPTTHLGPAATARERRGERTERGDIHRQAVAERLAWQQEQAAQLANQLTGAGSPAAVIESLQVPLQENLTTMPPTGIEAEHAALAAAAAPYRQQIEQHGAITQRDGLTWSQRAMDIAAHWRDAARNWMLSWQRSASVEPERKQPEIE